MWRSRTNSSSREVLRERALDALAGELLELGQGLLLTVAGLDYVGQRASAVLVLGEFPLGIGNVFRVFQAGAQVVELPLGEPFDGDGHFYRTVVLRLLLEVGRAVFALGGRLGATPGGASGALAGFESGGRQARGIRGRRKSHCA